MNRQQMIALMSTVLWGNVSRIGGESTVDAAVRVATSIYDRVVPVPEGNSIRVPKLPDGFGVDNLRGCWDND